jgi:hypothetical protein
MFRGQAIFLICEGQAVLDCLYRNVVNYHSTLRNITEEQRTYTRIKGKVHPITGHESPEGEQRYSSTLSLTLALDGGGWSTPRPGRFTPGKETRYQLYRRLGGPQGRSGRVLIISPPPGFDPRTVQLVASRYTYWAIGAPYTRILLNNTIQVIRAEHEGVGIIPVYIYSICTIIRSSDSIKFGELLDNLSDF